MKFAVILALFACVALSVATPVANEEGSPVAAPEKTEAEAPAAPAAAEGKDLDTANSYIYGGYPYYGGYYGGYGGYPYYYGGYGGYGAYGVPAYYGLYY